MNCNAPIPYDDGVPPPIGECPDCGLVHRIDLGCPAAERGGMRLVCIVLFLAVCLVGAAVVCVGALLR